MIIEILNDSGSVVNTIVATPEFAEQQFPGKWRLVATAESEKVIDWRITHYAFMTRFTESELVELDLIGQDDRNAQPATRRNSAKVRRALKMFEAAKFIDLKLQATREGVLQMMQMLQAAGIVADATVRSSQVLDTEPSSDELWKS